MSRSSHNRIVQPRHSRWRTTVDAMIEATARPEWWRRVWRGTALFALLMCACSIVRAQSCNMSTQPVDFGVYDPIETVAPITATGSVRVSCDFATVTIALGPGSGSYANRTLRQGPSVLNYNLYTQSSYTTVWGDGSPGTATVSRFVWFFNNPQTFPVYGRILPAQDPAAGPHSDTIVVTVTF